MSCLCSIKIIRLYNIRKSKKVLLVIKCSFVDKKSTKKAANNAVF